jgi:hypothetical protein
MSSHAIALRQAVLAVSVLDDVDVTPVDAGVVVGGAVTIFLPWADIRQAIGDHPPHSAIARKRLSMTLRLHDWAASARATAADQLRMAARLLALPPGHAMHPGPRWVRERVLGGALECGVGLVAMLDDDDEVTPLPICVAEATGIDQAALWPALRAHAESMGTLAANRLRRDLAGARRSAGTATDQQAVLRPVGGLDVLSLLATSTVRSYLAGVDGSGMCAIAVPMRSRGWHDLARIDPAYVQAAWSATDEAHRGVNRPLLVTTHEVALGPSGGDTISLVLRDKAPQTIPLARNVRYR